MKTSQINIINKLNKSFYKQVENEFFHTRQYTRKGWEELLPYIKSSTAFLDLGCGDGGFYGFVTNHLARKISYIGCDNNKIYLKNASANYPDAKFIKIDILQNLHFLHDSYDFISCFGITHHIPGRAFRNNWFIQVAGLVQDRGILAISFWDFDQDPRFKKAVPAKNMEKNDYFYGWGKTSSIRYVHIYSTEEKHEIAETMKTNKLHLLNTYKADGNNNKLNEYYIWKKM